MRSRKEILHRAWQEFRNAKLLLARPKAPRSEWAAVTSRLPVPSEVAARLAPTPYGDEVRHLAGRMVQHRFQVFDRELELPDAIDWRRDYLSRRSTGLNYFRRIPYLDVTRAGDHKWIWELNRHQHFVVLAQAFLMFGDAAFLDEIDTGVHSWMKQNPFQRGINWVSALEVAFRAISWWWVLHLVGPHITPRLRETMDDGLYLHGLHIENNLSRYFSPNTHLLGEAVALHALGLIFGHTGWQETGSRIAAQEIENQIQEDGSHFEQSTYYHVYALDMLLFHAALNPPTETFALRLAAMADFLEALLGYDRRLPFFGDDDGGRWMHPYGARDEFGRATLATCNTLFRENRWLACEQDYREQACWLLPPFNAGHEYDAPVFNSKLFRNSGIAVMHADQTKVCIDAGAFGRGSAGHSHADTLSLTVTAEDRELLIDPGTYTYVGSIDDRNAFRGTVAHTTIRIDGVDQAMPAGPFRWAGRPSTHVETWETSKDEDLLRAECSYAGYRHRRLVQFVKPWALLVVDEVEGDTSEHVVDQLWHLSSRDFAGYFRFVQSSEMEMTWRSRCFGQREPAPVLKVSYRGTLPVVLPAAICLRDGVDVEIKSEGEKITFILHLGSETKHVSVNCMSSCDNHADAAVPR